MAIPNWLHLSTLSGSGDTIVTITADTWESLTSRTASLVVSGNTKSVTVPVTQDPHDFADDYLTFRITSVGTIRWTRDKLGSYQATPKAIQYSKNGGEWTTIWSSIASASPGTYIDVYEGDVLEFKGDNETYWNYVSSGNMWMCGGSFQKSTAGFTVEGNIMSLIDSENFRNLTTLTGSRAFAEMFGDANGYTRDFCPGLTSVRNLTLPATTLSEHCYEGMFGGCTALTDSPVICATTMTEYCYAYMFDSCSSLVNPPSLPSTTLAPNCYYAMFAGCTSLVNPPTLPATTLEITCYGYMFEQCSSLASAPVLPATTMFTSCYIGMFHQCTALTTPPALPATTLALRCYSEMFEGCSALTSAPSLPATTLANACYIGMFKYCTSLTTSPVLPATTLATGCYNSMFIGCSALTSITSYATTNITQSELYRWTEGVASAGTFTKVASASWPSGANGIPYNWTVVSV